MNILALKRQLLPMSGFQMDGGGGSNTGGGTSVTDLPEWARGYAKDTLAKGAALTDINQNKYQTYGGDRTAGFSPLQTKAMQGAADMQTGPEAFQKGVTGYMNPYIEQALKPQIAEANRGYDVSGQKQAGQATQAGAFGGGRDSIMRAENERNRNMGIQNIVGQGYNTAFNNAQNQYNTGFNQNIMTNQLQNQYGAMQQNQAQKGLDIGYQDFQNQQNYPYKQIGFMSDLLRGMPMGQSTTKSMYEPTPGVAQQVGAAGAGAYGLSKLMADGGMAYADGGSVDSPDNVAAIVHTLSDEDLQKAMQAAQARGDQEQLMAVQNEMGMRASLKNGIAGGVTDEMAQRMAAAGGLMDSYAGGGVLAFDGGTNGSYIPPGTESKGNQKYYDDAGAYAIKALDKLRNRKGYQGLTRDEREDLEKETVKRLQQYGGEDIYAPMAEKLKGFETDRAKNLEEGKGLAALQAIPAFLQGGNAARGIASGIGALGGGFAQVAKADTADKRALADMSFNLAGAKRKERMGIGKEALGNVKDVEANRIAADAAERKAITDEIVGASGLAKAYRPIKASGSGADKTPKIAEQNYANILADLKATETPNAGETPAQFNARIARKASELAVAQAKTSDAGTNRTNTANDANDLKRQQFVAEEIRKVKITPEYKEGNTAQKKALEAEAEARGAKRATQDSPASTSGGTIKPIKLD